MGNGAGHQPRRPQARADASHKLRIQVHEVIPSSQPNTGISPPTLQEWHARGGVHGRRGSRPSTRSRGRQNAANALDDMLHPYATGLPVAVRR